jgi:hypothetical protein
VRVVIDGNRNKIGRKEMKKVDEMRRSKSQLGDFCVPKAALTEPGFFNSGGTNI